MLLKTFPCYLQVAGVVKKKLGLDLSGAYVGILARQMGWGDTFHIHSTYGCWFLPPTLIARHEWASKWINIINSSMARVFFFDEQPHSLKNDARK